MEHFHQIIAPCFPGKPSSGFAPHLERDPASLAGPVGHDTGRPAFPPGLWGSSRQPQCTHSSPLQTPCTRPSLHQTRFMRVTRLAPANPSGASTERPLPQRFSSHPPAWKGIPHPSNSVSPLSDFLLSSYHLKLRGLLIPPLVYGPPLLS